MSIKTVEQETVEQDITRILSSGESMTEDEITARLRLLHGLRVAESVILDSTLEPWEMAQKIGSIFLSTAAELSETAYKAR